MKPGIKVSGMKLFTEFTILYLYVALEPGGYNPGGGDTVLIKMLAILSCEF